MATVIDNNVANLATRIWEYAASCFLEGQQACRDAPINIAEIMTRAGVTMPDGEQYGPKRHTKAKASTDAGGDDD